jgi:hypothetical protein
MAPGGVTETISYFMGYIHLINETAKAREAYDGSYNTLTPEDFIQARARYSVAHDADELDSAPIRVALSQSPADTFGDLRVDLSSPSDVAARNVSFTLPTAKFVPPDGSVFVSGRIASVPRSGSGDPIPPTIDITYGSSGGNLANVNQSNWLVDMDKVGPIGQAAAAQLHPVDVPAALNAMFELLEEKIGPDLVPPLDGDLNALVQFIEARDNATLAEGGTDASVEPGVYVDGVLQPVGTRPDVPELPTRGEIDQVTGDKVGLSTDTGSNASVNAASIFDTDESNTAMVVLGNVFATNGIVQANIYRDNDHVEVAGPHEIRDLITGENLTKNVAEFIAEEPGLAVIGRSFRSLEWHVDMIEGDMFGINLLTQRNLLRDNDITFQSEFASYYEVRTGENHQINLSSLMSWGDYDLIIIGGDYHAANWIFQTNILLDDDFLQIASNRPDTASQAISSGENTLLNDASIAKIGGHGFVPLTDDVLRLVQGLQSGSLDPETAFQIPGHGNNEVSVLFITGDYYDLNVISQINIVVDIDVAIQMLGEGDRHEPDATQEASTGSNVLMNLATIVDVGAISDYQFVGGDFYDDAILIQTNIISGEDEDDVVEIRDTDTLVSEIVAFTEELSASEADRQIAPTSTVAGADEGVGGMLH